MLLPKSVTPDNLVEALIEFRFAASKPFDVIPGLLFPHFDETYAYTNKPLMRPVIDRYSRKRSIADPVVGGAQSILYNEGLILQIFPGKFVFSLFERQNYPGWAVYEKEIVKALENILKADVVSKWVRVGLRYISEYPEMDLKDFTKFRFEFGHPKIVSSSSSFRSDFMYNDSRIVLHLHHKIPLLSSQEVAKEVLTSVVDIDVIKETMVPGIEIDALMGIVNDAHVIEKEIYFQMLDEKYLQQKKPKY